MVRRRVSARRPGPELVGVEYCPKPRDLAACDVERVYRHGDAVQLGDQTRLAVDRTLQDRQVGYRTGPVSVEPRDLLGALDRAQDGCDEAAAAVASWRDALMPWSTAMSLRR
jgi:hypothetical protein